MRRRMFGATTAFVLACASISGCAPGNVATAPAEKWSIAFAEPVHVMTAGPNAAIVASSDAQTLAAIMLADGSTSWSVPMAPMPSSADVRGDTLVVAQTVNGNQLVSGLHLRTGEREWSRVVTTGSLVGAWGDGQAVVSDEDGLRVLDAANAVRAEWTPPDACTLTRAVVAPGTDSWVAALTDCAGESRLTRLDATLHAEWEASAGDAVNVTFRGDAMVLSALGSDVTLVAPNGEAQLDTAGTELPGLSLLRRTFESDVVDLQRGGERFTGIFPSATALGPFAATNVSIMTATGTELAHWTQTGSTPQLVRLTERTYLVGTFTSEAGFLSLLDVGAGGPSPSASQPSPPLLNSTTVRSTALGSVELVPSDLIAATRGVEVSIMESGVLGRRLGAATVFIVDDPSATERILQLTSHDGSTFDEPNHLSWTEHGVRSARGSCLLSVVLDDTTTPLDAGTALALSNAILDTSATGACR